jgi:hypothetical protein
MIPERRERTWSEKRSARKAGIDSILAIDIRLGIFVRVEVCISLCGCVLIFFSIARPSEGGNGFKRSRRIGDEIIERGAALEDATSDPKTGQRIATTIRILILTTTASDNFATAARKD